MSNIVDIFSNGIKQALANKIQSKIYIYSFSTNERFYFPAFVTDFTDSFQSNWNMTEVYGKMDPIATFKNTSRAINISFDLPSNGTDALVNAGNIDRIIQGLYPVYTKDLGGISILSSPPLFRIKFANFIENANVKQTDKVDNYLSSGLLGYFKNFDFKPDMSQGVLEIDNRIFPKLIKVSLAFNIIHEHVLGYQRTDKGLLPRIHINKATFSHRFAQDPKAELAKAIEAKEAESYKKIITDQEQKGGTGANSSAGDRGGTSDTPLELDNAATRSVEAELKGDPKTSRKVRSKIQTLDNPKRDRKAMLGPPKKQDVLLDSQGNSWRRINEWDRENNIRDKMQKILDMRILLQKSDIDLYKQSLPIYEEMSGFLNRGYVPNYKDAVQYQNMGIINLKGTIK